MFSSKTFVVSIACLATMTLAASAEAVNQKIKYGIFKEECYDKFLAFDIDQDCAKFTLSKVIGFLIILGSMIVKVPQILKITASGSVDGLSSFSMYMDFISFLNLIGNSRRQGLNFSVYGEAVFINF